MVHAIRRGIARASAAFGLLPWLLGAQCTGLAWAQVPAPAQGHDAGAAMSPISGPIENLRRHSRLRNPSQLEPRLAEEVYSILAGAMRIGYGRSAVTGASEYQAWRRVSTAPYSSITHGNHYLNNYVNDVGAKAYLRYEAGGEMPVGSIIAKDSFAATDTGELLLGPLFIMEKKPHGFFELTNDWQFTQIQPDGTLVGQTAGRGSNRVRYCIGCHLSGHRDLLYFLPEAYRAPR